MTSMAEGVRAVRRTKSRTAGQAAAAEEELGYPPGQKAFGITAPSLDFEGDYMPGYNENAFLIVGTNTNNPDPNLSHKQADFIALRKLEAAIKLYIQRMTAASKGKPQHVINDMHRYVLSVIGKYTKIRNKVFTDNLIDLGENARLSKQLKNEEEAEAAAASKPRSKRVRFPNTEKEGGGRRRTRRRATRKN